MSNMQIDFVIHGVPQGHQVWGTRSDKYYETFYGQYDIYRKTKMVFVVEVRDNNGLRSCYYSLIRPQNILAAGGRKGSYFGMSIRVEGCYCTDVYSLFKLFELTYDQFIANKILVKNGESEQFAYESLETPKSIFTDASKYILSQIQTHLNSEFEEIDNSFTKKNAQITEYYHPDDVNCEAFLNATKLDGRVIISDDYPTKDSMIRSYKNREKQYQDTKKTDDEQIDSLKKENDSLKVYKQKYNGQVKELEDLRANDQKLKTNLNAANAEIASLKQKNSSLASQVDQIKNAANIRQIASSLEKSMSDMLPILQSVAPHSHYDNSGTNYREEKHSKNKEDDFSIILMIVLIIAILAGIFFFIRAKKANSQLSELEKERIELETKYRSLDENYTNLNNTYQSTRNNGTYEASFKKIFPQSRIDIKDYHGEDLVKGKEYTVTILQYQGDGEWTIEGFDLKKGSLTKDKSIIVAPNSEGSVNLVYKVGGQAVLKRALNVQ